MKHALAAAAVTAILTGTCLTAGLPAQAASTNSGCVTYSEYKRARVGMSVAEVARLFGTKGKQSTKSSSYGTTIEIRTYDGCTSYGVVSVLFMNGRLDTKSQAGL